MNKNRLNQRGSHVMFIIAWLLFFGLLFMFFQQWQHPENAEFTQTPTTAQVLISPGRHNHYEVDGKINGHKVTFFVDTGASSVSIPQNIADEIGLKGGYPAQASTANGVVTVYLTRIDSLEIGPIKLKNIRAAIHPSMAMDNILLGMSALNKLQISTTDEGKLSLTQERR